MKKQIYESTYDDSTKLKLELLKGYISEWIPVFLSRRIRKAAIAYDFFAGRGRDEAGNPGSSIIILNEFIKYLRDPKTPKAKNVNIILYFSDSNEQGISELDELVRNINHEGVDVEIKVLNFKDAFEEQNYKLLDGDNAKFVFIDQYGMKEVSPEILLKLTSSPTTDILFYVSSSSLYRFWAEETARKYFPSLKQGDKKPSHANIHRFVCELYRQTIAGRKYYLSSFSIKKDGSGNINGLIFGSSTLLGLEKFLTVCWKIDKIHGEANYDIDDDQISIDQGKLFVELEIPKKLEIFEISLIEYIGNSGRNNLEIYEFTLVNGFLPKHAKEILDKYRALGRLRFLQRVKGGTGSRSYGLMWKLYRDNRITFAFRMENQ